MSIKSADSRPRGSIWFLLSAMLYTTSFSLAWSVALDRLTFNCSVESCTADSLFLLVMPLVFAFAWGAALDIAPLWVSACTAGIAGVIGTVTYMLGPPDPEKAFIVGASVLIVIVGGILVGWPAAALGRAYAARVSRDHAANGWRKSVGALVMASAALVAIAAWLPWISVQGPFGEVDWYVLNGIEVRWFGAACVTCAAGLGLAGAAIWKGRRLRMASVAALVTSLVSAVALLAVLLWAEPYEKADRVAQHATSGETPLRFVDLGLGPPLAVASITISTCLAVLVIRVRSTVQSESGSRGTLLRDRSLEPPIR